MPRTKVRKTKIPIAILHNLEGEVVKEFERVRQTGMQVIERDLRASDRDPDEHELAGSQATLEKSTTRQESQHAQALRNYERRLRHGAPFTPALGEQAANALLHRLPTRGGTVKTDTQNGRQATAKGRSRERAVPLAAVVAIPSFTTLELRDALTGKQRSIPTAVKHPGTEAYTLTSGGAEFLAARIYWIPALEMEVEEPADAQPLPPDPEPATDRTELETIGREVTRELAYRLPSTVEPLAELARKHDRDTYLQVAAGGLSEPELEARARADRKEDERAATWLKIYNEKVQAGKSTEEANAEVRKDPRWMRVEELAETTREIRIKTEERWESWREEYRRALELSREYASEDRVELPETFNHEKVWNEAQKGQPVTEDDRSAGYPGGSYQPDQEVEIADTQGNWHKATVSKVDGFDVRVRRKDGQYRLIKDPTKIRAVETDVTKPEGNVDTAPTVWYNTGMDAAITLPEFNVTLPAGSNSLRIERSLEPITAEMNQTPLKVNPETWAKNLNAVQRLVDRLTDECRAKAGWDKFRPNASADCIEVFHVKRGLPPQRVTKGKGQPAMDKETLGAFQAMGDDLAGLVIEAREAMSCLSQLRAWEPYAQAGSVQAKWNQLGTPHGRYSCDSPNLQNRIVEIRETIEAPVGYKFLSLDLGQAEYVTWASLSQDPTLAAAFSSGTDFHTVMGQEILNAVPEIDLHGRNPREIGKTINFALVYLMQPFVLAKRLGSTTDQAQKVMDAYFARAPIAKDYMDRIIAEIRRSGIARTKFGRTRQLSEIKMARQGKLHELTKTLWHHHNAGTAAEVLKIKQVRAWKALRREMDQEQARIALQMHDEVIFQVKDECVERATELAEGKFHEAIEGLLPFRVDVRVGQNWRQISK